MSDLLRAGKHSRYFDHTRSHYLFLRVRLVAWILMVLLTAWIPVDALLLPDPVSEVLAYGRLAASGCCLLLGLWFFHPYRLEISLVRLFLLILVLTVFQVWSNAMLHQHGIGEDTLAGYGFFSFMIITMLAIFPLTVFEVAGFAGFVLLVELTAQLWQGHLGQVQGLNDLWLLSVLGVIAGWAAVNQLHMLLVLYRQATRDPLTGLANRRQVMDQLDEDIEDVQLRHRPLAIMLFDLDKFKGFNDNYGHAAGDIVLKQFARILKENTKGKSELAGRFGGEEFLVILPDTDREQALARAEAILQSCRQARLKVPTGDEVGFTTSIGVALLEPGESHSRLLQRVDEALYEAKESGRDRCCFAGVQAQSPSEGEEQAAEI